MQFNGIQSSSLLQLLKAASQSVALENNPPSTVAALRRRGEADIPRFNKVFQSQGYYDPLVELNLRISGSLPQVIFNMQTGPLFTFAAFEIVPTENSPLQCFSISLSKLEISLKSTAYPKNILKAEEILLTELASEGYPLAAIKDRRVVADLSAHTVSVKLTVDSGPLSYFGETNISGAVAICPPFFSKKISWNKGEVFNPAKIEETIRLMEASALFSSIDIHYAETTDEQGYLPMQIDVVEAKHRSLGFGVGYSTLRSFGIMGEYENRNERHLGERFRLQIAFWNNVFERAPWNNLFDGTFLYVVPDWCKKRQDLIWLIQARHEYTEGYTESYLSASLGIERQVNKNLRTSAGVMFKTLKNERSDNNGLFNLFKIPLGIRWMQVNDLLDPSKGYGFSFKTIPTFEVLNDPFVYIINLFNGSLYLPLNSTKDFVLTLKTNLGSIAGSTRRDIPPSERLYAGSEDTLRGYKYLTVSPLDSDKDPIGGRSMMVFSVELRRRLKEDWGLTLFYDIGNVYEESLPTFNHKQLQSLGAGVRYHTPVGPLRFDVAFPLNRRRGVDHLFEVYLSLGQTF